MSVLYTVMMHFKSNLYCLINAIIKEDTIIFYTFYKE